MTVASMTGCGRCAVSHAAVITIVFCVVNCSSVCIHIVHVTNQQVIMTGFRDGSFDIICWGVCDFNEKKAISSFELRKKIVFNEDFKKLFLHFVKFQ